MEYPANKQTETFGTAVFWAEEYWASVKLESLRNKNPNLDLSGFVNTSFQKRLSTVVKELPHTKIQGTRNYSDLEKISPPLWDDQRRFINLSPSHAPSRYIAQKYFSDVGNDLAIISFDAHFDLASPLGTIHGNWLSDELSKRTAVIGGWAEASSDRRRAQHSLRFLTPSFISLIDDPEFTSWLSGKKTYVTIDLDYFTIGQSPFLGYANYWHRNRIIGHTLNLDQLLESKKEDNSNIDWLGELFDYPNLGGFSAKKKKNIRRTSSELFRILAQLAEAFEETPTVSLLALDIVEYSPICDWNFLTLKELIDFYWRFWALFHSYRIG
ncbi:MAG: arginase family protein [Candidatus Thorarchaeota archaeon]